MHKIVYCVVMYSSRKLEVNIPKSGNSKSLVHIQYYAAIKIIFISKKINKN